MYRRLHGEGQVFCLPPYTSVCEISRLWEAISSLVFNKSLSNLAVLLVKGALSSDVHGFFPNLSISKFKTVEGSVLGGYHKSELDGHSGPVVMRNSLLIRTNQLDPDSLFLNSLHGSDGFFGNISWKIIFSIFNITCPTGQFWLFVNVENFIQALVLFILNSLLSSVDSTLAEMLPVQSNFCRRMFSEPKCYNMWQ